MTVGKGLLLLPSEGLCCLIIIIDTYTSVLCLLHHKKCCFVCEIFVVGNICKHGKIRKLKRWITANIYQMW